MRSAETDVATAPETAPTADAGANSAEQAFASPLVEDGAVLTPGRMGRREFFAALDVAVGSAVDDALRPRGLTAQDCPYLARYLEHFRHEPMERVARAVVLYADPQRHDPQGWIDAVAARARLAATRWVEGRTDPVVGELSATGRQDLQDWRRDPTHTDPARAAVHAQEASDHIGQVAAGDPGAALLGQVARLGPGEPLSSQQRQRVERGLGVDASTVRVHRADVPGMAVTAGEHVVLGPNAPPAGTLGNDVLLAHEVAHAAQQRQGGTTDATGAETDADAAAVSMLAGAAARPGSAGTSLRLARCGALPTPGDPDAEVRRLGTEQIIPVPTTPPPSITQAPAFKPPTTPAAGLGERLESPDPAVRAAAVAQLGMASGPEGWRSALIAMDSSQPDVATAAERLVVGWLARPDFLAWLAALPAQGSGQLGDIAVRVLGRAGQGAQVDLEAYRSILRQELVLLRGYRREILSGPQSADATSDRAFADLESGLSATDPLKLADVGRRISRLLERFTLVRAELARSDSVGAQQGADQATQQLVAAHRKALVSAAATISADQDDRAFATVLQGMRQFTIDLAQATLNQLSTYVEQSRKELGAVVAAKGQRFSVERLVSLCTPLLPELDALAARITALRASVQAHPVAVMQNLNSLQATIADLMDRTRLVRAAVNMEAAAHAVEWNPPSVAGEFAGTQVSSYQQLYVDLRVHRDNFALMAERYRSNPEATRQLEQEEGRLVEETGQDLEVYQSLEQARANLAMVQLQLDLAAMILVLSAWTGGLAGEAAVGGMELLGIGGMIGGRGVIWVGSVIAEGSVFYATQRGLDWAVHGGQGPVFPDTWKRDMALSIGTMGVLKATGGLFNVIAGARPPTTGLAVGRFATSYAALMAYSTIVEPWVKGEERPGLGTAKFWAHAGETLLMMGAVHVGLSAMRPITLRITAPLYRARIAAHNVRSERLGVDLQAAFSGEGDPAAIRSVVRRSRALLLERQGLLRQVAERSVTPDFTQPEFAELNPLIETQIRLADSTLVLDTFRVRPLGIGRNAFGYEGTMETVRQHLESRGFKLVSEDPATGLLRMVDPAGTELAFIRMHAGATGADPSRMPPETALDPKEQNRRAATAYETIRELTDDVPQVAQRTGVPQPVVEAVKQHLFVRVHQIPVGPGRANVQRFDPMYGIARLWMRAYEGALTATEASEFRRLMAHEYVEQGLMAAGMPYRSAHPRAWRGDESHGGPQHYGAHEVAPNEGRADPFAHRPAYGLPGGGQAQPKPGEMWDYDAALRTTFESLAAQSTGPYRVVADPAAPQGYRVEARDPAELGTVDPTRTGARATGATGPWAGVRTQLVGQGLSADEATALAGLLAAAGRTPTTATDVTALTADQLRQLLPLDGPGLTRVLGIDAQLLPTALALMSSPNDVLGGRALDALIQRIGQPAVLQVLQPAAANQAMLPELGRNALATMATPTPTTPWAEAHSQSQLQAILDAPGSGFARYQHPTTGTLIPEPGFRAGAPMNMGRRQAQAAKQLGNATFPDVFGTVTGPGQQQAMEIKTPRVGETVASHFQRADIARGIISQQAGRVANLPAGTESYLVVDIRQTGQTISEALGDLSTVLRNYSGVGDARGLWNGVRFITGTRTAANLSGIYQIPR